MESLEGKQVLVTGASGFLGARVSEILVQQQGAVVTGLGRDFGKVGQLREAGVNLVAADLTDSGALKAQVKGMDVVIHAAAALQADAETAQKINVEATEALVRLAAEAGVKRFVHVSTVGVYDMGPLARVPESTPLAVSHPSTYPRTKAQAEQRAVAAAQGTGMELSIVRPSMIYGPGHGIWSAGMYQNVQQGKPVMLGDGSATFNPVFVDDVAEAIMLCAKHPKAAGEAFNVSAGTTSWNAFMAHYATLSGKKHKGAPILVAKLLAWANKIPGVTTPIDQGFIEMATSSKEFPTDKAFGLLGWKPKVSLEDGMAQTLDWLREVFGGK